MFKFPTGKPEKPVGQVTRDTDLTRTTSHIEAAQVKKYKEKLHKPVVSVYHERR